MAVVHKGMKATRETAPLLISLCCVGVALLGTIGALSWASNNPTLTSLGENYLPIAPNTAVSFVLLGLSFFAIYQKETKLL